MREGEAIRLEPSAAGAADDDKKGDKTKRAERLRNRNHAKPIGRDERKHLELQALTEAVTHSLDGNSDETRRKAVAQLEEHKKEMREKNLLRKTEIKLRATTVKRLVSSFDETNVGQKMWVVPNAEDGNCLPRALMQSMKHDEEIWPGDEIVYSEKRMQKDPERPAQLTVDMIREEVASVLIDPDANADYRRYGKHENEESRTDIEMSELAINARDNVQNEESGVHWFERLHVKVVSDMIGLPVYLITVVMKSDASAAKCEVALIMPKNGASASGTLINNRALYLIHYQYHNFGSHYHALKWKSENANDVPALELVLPQNLRNMVPSPGFPGDFHSEEADFH